MTYMPKIKNSQSFRCGCILSDITPFTGIQYAKELRLFGTAYSDNRALGENRSVDVDIETQNKIIDEVNDDAIFSAVKDANGYGKRYIQLLKDTGRLTHEKADQFRNAMKKLGIIAIPITIGVSK